jgi:hypothetical protein
MVGESKTLLDALDDILLPFVEGRVLVELCPWFVVFIVEFEDDPNRSEKLKM